MFLTLKRKKMKKNKYVYDPFMIFIFVCIVVFAIAWTAGIIYVIKSVL